MFVERDYWQELHRTRLPLTSISNLQANTGIKHSTIPLIANSLRWATRWQRRPVKWVTFTKIEEGKGQSSSALDLWTQQTQVTKSCLMPQGERRLSQRISYSQPKGNLNSSNLICVEKQGRERTRLQTLGAWCHLCITVVSGAGWPISTMKEELLVMVLLALTALLSWISFFFSSATFSKDVMAMHRVTQNEIRLGTCHFQCKPAMVLQKMVLALYN